MRKRLFNFVLLIIICAVFATCFVACDKGDGYEAWKNSDIAEDFNEDRRINEEDYKIYQGYMEWKNSEKAYDYSGDKKIDWDDYMFSINPNNVDFVSWVNSDMAYDYNSDKVIDEKDFYVYVNYKDIIGKFKVVNFYYTVSGIFNFYLDNSRYSLHDLAQDVGSFDFEISKDLKLTCKYGETVKQKLREDENAVLSAIDSCHFEKSASGLITASFTIQGLPFTVYLTKTESRFSSSVNVTIRRSSAYITFNIVYVD